MSYREKTPTVISIFQRKLKPGKTFEDFQQAHLPPSGEVKKRECGYEVEFFGVPTRVINAVSAEDPTIVYSIGLSYGEVSEIFSEAMNKSKEDQKPGQRKEQLEAICEEIFPLIIAFVYSDNDYGGEGLDYQQAPLAQVTPEVTEVMKRVKKQRERPNP